VYHSDPPYRSFAGPITLADGIDADDITAIAALPDGSIGVLWSNQATQRFGFRRHRDGSPPGATAWSADEIPASHSAVAVRGGMADDHVNLAVASDGTLYAAVKTSYNRVGFPQLALLVRRPNGSWDDLYGIDEVGTRAIVVLDETAATLRVVHTTADGGGAIVSRMSPLAPIAFGPPEVLIAGFLDNATSTRAVCDGEVVILASDGIGAQGVLIESAPGSGSTTSSSTSTSTSTTSTSTTSTSSTTTSPSTTSTGPSTTSTSTTSTTTLPQPPVVLALGPAADTYIESGSQATWAHGGATQMHVDSVPWDVTYLKFDLTGVPATVHSAVLRLRCTNHSGDGGTIYPVADSSWIEGTVTGSSSSSAGRPGLKWSDVDTNRDGTLSAADSSPFLPDFGAPIATLGEVDVGETVEVDVTRAVQSGPGLYTLALRSGRIDNRATYVSKEHTNALLRPVLVLTAGP
jgi:hypothetical protein